jgi:myb proto-oncogene protein
LQKNNNVVTGSGKPWTPEEDCKLAELVKKHGTTNWYMISTYFDDRRSAECYHRWCKKIDPKIIKGKWSNEEDLKLVVAVQVMGKGNWSKVAEHVPNRTDV